MPTRHPNEQGKGKIVDDFSSQKKQSQHHHKSGSRGQHCSAQGLIDTGVDYIHERDFAAPPEIFPDSVEDDDSVVQGISYNGQKRRNDNQRKFFIRDGERTHSDKNVMNKSDDSGDSILQFEPPGNINDRCQ